MKSRTSIPSSNVSHSAISSATKPALTETDLTMVCSGTAEGLPHDTCYRALAARDARFDGVFFTGVKTTGIYCRPICSARTPRVSSCLFFATAAAAEAAGFRPCLRCRPELAPYAVQQNLAYAIWQRITAGALNDGNVERLAEEVGLSSRQMRRVLLQYFGVTPIELAQTQRLLFAKKLLQETCLPIADVAFASGFGSVRRFNDLFSMRYKIEPREIRRTGGSKAILSDRISLRLTYRSPFAWTQILNTLAERCMPLVESVQSAYVRTIRMGDLTGWMHIAQDSEKDQLVITLSASMAPVSMPLLSRVRAQFDLDANPAVIEAHLKQDPLLAASIDRIPGVRLVGEFDVFEAGLCVILREKGMAAGNRSIEHLIRHFGQEQPTPFADVTHRFPDAELFARQTISDLVQLGVSKVEAASIIALAKFSAQGHMQVKAGQDIIQLGNSLRSIPGLSEQMVRKVIRQDDRFPDVFFTDDGRLLNITGMTAGELNLRAQAWAPWRAYATAILLHSDGCATY